MKNPQKIKVGILTSHPIQYQAPLFRSLQNQFDLHVFYAHRPTSEDQAKAGFGVSFNWDVDLLEGYRHTFLENKAPFASLNHFLGCDTPSIGSIICAENFDAFILMGWHLKSYWQALFACKKNKVPVLVRGDSQLPTPRPLLLTWFKQLFFSFFLRQFDGYLYVGERNRNYLIHYGAAAEKMFFAPHCVDNDWFSEKGRLNKDEANQEMQKTDIGRCRLLFVGKLIKKKRPLDLIYAASLIKQHYPQVECIFVGAGKEEKKIREAAQRNDIGLQMLGFKNQTELPKYYREADMLILPSDGRETWGLVVNEAMACGKPAIVSDKVGCSEDLIEQGKTGFTYPLANIEKLSEAIMALIKINRADLEINIQNKIKKYSIEAAANGISQAVKVLVCGRRG